MATQTSEIEQVVSRYHQAIAEKDLKTTLGCIGHGYWGDAKATEAMKKRTVRAFKSAKTAYANKIEFVHTTVAEKAGLALVVTIETGSSSGWGRGTLSWKGATNLWCLTKSRGKWRIIRSVHNLGKGRASRAG